MEVISRVEVEQQSADDASLKGFWSGVMSSAERCWVEEMTEMASKLSGMGLRMLRGYEAWSEYLVWMALSILAIRVTKSEV